MSTSAWLIPSFGAFLLWGVSQFVPKLAVARLSPFSQIAWSGLSFCLLTGIVLACTGFDLRFDPQGALLAWSIGLCGFTGQLFYVMALKQGTVTRVSIVTALYPLGTTVLSVLFLHETLTLRQMAGIVLCLAAVVLLTGGGKDD